MKMAVTAASGRLGEVIIQELSSRVGKQNVVGLARTPSKAGDLGIEIRKGDYDRASDFAVGLQGIEVAIIISGMATPDQRIPQHRNIIEGAKQAGVRKLVYTSIFGEAGKCSFDAIINSNRQTEEDIRSSGLDWVIGRNGLYIEADLASIEDYKIAGNITNSAGDGRCGYTSRTELARAYATMALNEELNGKTYNLTGPSITQNELTTVLNQHYDLNLVFRPVSIEEYLEDRTAAHGEFLGPIIAGIYQGIREGAFEVPSDFQKVTGRPHQSLVEMVEEVQARTG